MLILGKLRPGGAWLEEETHRTCTLETGPHLSLTQLPRPRCEATAPISQMGKQRCRETHAPQGPPADTWQPLASTSDSPVCNTHPLCWEGRGVF